MKVMSAWVWNYFLLLLNLIPFDFFVGESVLSVGVSVFFDAPFLLFILYLSASCAANVEKFSASSSNSEVRFEIFDSFSLRSSNACIKKWE